MVHTLHLHIICNRHLSKPILLLKVFSSRMHSLTFHMLSIMIKVTLCIDLCHLAGNCCAATLCKEKPMTESEIIFLDGPHSRLKELTFTFETMWGFIKGFRALHFIGPCITIFGSARFSEDHPYYQLTRQASAAFAKLGFTILTGGGPGLMEAANRGAKDVNGKSVGCNIQLPVEQQPNKYLDKWVYVKHFFVRKVLLVKYSFAFVVMPGGYGTMDEYFEALTLIQTHKIDNFPVIIFGKEYHKELLQHIEMMRDNDTIGKDDTKLFLITDSIEEAINLIKEKSIKQYGLKPKNMVKPFKWLFEHN
jgi:uncharacterized protein (TIGR00730 family)